MDGHEGDLVVDILSLLFRHVHGAEQGDVLEKVREGHERDAVVRYLVEVFQITVRKHVLPVLIRLALHELLDAVHQFLDIPGLGLGLHRTLSLERGIEPAGVAYRSGQHICVLSLEPVADPRHHIPEFNQTVQGGALETIFRKIRQGYGLEEGAGGVGCGACKGFDRGVAYASGGSVDDSPERLVIPVVDDKLEIGHHILDFGAVEEGMPCIYAVWEIPFPECLLYGLGLAVGPVEYREILVSGVV